jgi:DNA-binding MarR family transcriptional regulator
MFMKRNQLIEQFLETLVRFKQFLDQSVPVDDRVGTLLQFYAIRFLDRHPDSTVGELAEGLQMSSSAVSQLADRLVESGLVKKTNDSVDRRIVRLSNTMKGNAHLLLVSKRANKIGKEMFAKLSDEDLQTIIRVYNKFLSE